MLMLGVARDGGAICSHQQRVSTSTRGGAGMKILPIDHEVAEAYRACPFDADEVV